MNTERNYQDVIEDLRKMADIDQKMRMECDKNPGAWDESIDRANTETLKSIVATIGWPTISKVGKEEAYHAWLLVQHADHDVVFQKECLELMRSEEKGEVDLMAIAYLEDRIAIGEHRPQIYGTQFHMGDTGVLEPLPIQDPEGVNKRRAKMGLETLEENQRSLQQRYGQNT